MLLQVRRRFLNTKMLFFSSSVLLAARRIGHAVNTPSTEILFGFPIAGVVILNYCFFCLFAISFFRLMPRIELKDRKSVV